MGVKLLINFIKTFELIKKQIKDIKKNEQVNKNKNTGPWVVTIPTKNCRINMSFATCTTSFETERIKAWPMRVMAIAIVRFMLE